MPDPANVRRHPERNASASEASLRRFGPARSIVIDAKHVVRAGNLTLESAKAAGVTEVLVVEPQPGQLVAVKRADWTPSEGTAYAIADNRTGDLAENNDVSLVEQLRALQSEDFPIEAAGYTVDEMHDLVASLSDTFLATPPEPDQAEKDLANVDCRLLPKRVWVLIGVPVVKYALADHLVRRIAAIPEVLCETALSSMGDGQENR